MVNDYLPDFIMNWIAAALLPVSWIMTVGLLPSEERQLSSSLNEPEDFQFN